MAKPKLDTSFVYNKDVDEYHVQIQRARSHKWLWLLLLLPLLLLIPIPKQVNIEVADTDGNPMSDAVAGFAANEDEPTEKSTDKQGIASFNVSVPLWKYFCYMGDTASAYAQKDCYIRENVIDTLGAFTEVASYKIILAPVMKKVAFTAVDAQDGKTPLADAEITVDVSGLSEPIKIKTDSEGKTDSIEVWACADVTVIGSKEEYENDTVSFCASSSDGCALKLLKVGKSGDLQFTLKWNTINDLDLYVYCPYCVTKQKMTAVSFDSKQHKCTKNKSEGVLDVDANFLSKEADKDKLTDKPVESIYWLNPEDGTFMIGVVWCRYGKEGKPHEHGPDSAEYTLTIRNTATGEVKVYKDVIHRTDEPKTYTYDYKKQ